MACKYAENGGPCRGRTYGPLIKSAFLGVAQVLEDLGNPSSLDSFHAPRHSIEFFLFIAFYRLLSLLVTPI
jgi:hypothetical protein